MKKLSWASTAVVGTLVAVFLTAGHAARAGTAPSAASAGHRVTGHGAAGSSPFGIRPAAASTTTYRPLVGVGADTTESVMEAIAGVVVDGQGNKQIDSESTGGTPTVTVQDPATHPLCTIGRPNTAEWGIRDVEDSVGIGSGCVQFARTTTTTMSNYALTDVTYVPFGQDAIGVAVSRNSSLSVHLAKSDLLTLYTCQGGAGPKPVLPPWGSGTRRIFLNYLGLTDSEDFVNRYTCVSERTPTGYTLTDDNLAALTDPELLVPVSVANYLAQTWIAQPDRRANTRLVLLDGVPSRRALSPVSFVTSTNSNFPSSVTSADLALTYLCQQPGSWKPLLPPYGDPTRAAFMQQIGLADSAGFAAGHPCVTEVAMPNDGRQLSDANSVMPYSVPAYIAQLDENGVPDVTGGTRLGEIDNRPPMILNPAASMTHEIYNAVPTAELPLQTYASVFIGPTSAICQQTSLIANFGFTPISNCGDNTTKVGP